MLYIRRAGLKPPRYPATPGTQRVPGGLDMCNINLTATLNSKTGISCCHTRGAKAAALSSNAR